ncbi:MAG: hypothetical protein JOY62_09135 [Acidobacteriaceae bacterium]|nr:hypothetical protein [Acidobacteriaceae bacterium]MBV9780122.1 hypothetical protein [Acidobacteriaceae bacterium]
MISDRPEFTSDKRFDADHHLDGLLVVCGDGRFEEQVNDFREHLRQKLGLRRLDRYFVPGSQLQFSASETGHPSTETATDYWTRFFIDKHHLAHVVIVGHELCAAYRSAPAYQNFGPDQLRAQQTRDLLQTRNLIRQNYPYLRVHLYYMKPKEDDSGVEFFFVGK